MSSFVLYLFLCVFSCALFVPLCAFFFLRILEKEVCIEKSDFLPYKSELFEVKSGIFLLK